MRICRYKKSSLARFTGAVSRRKGHGVITYEAVIESLRGINDPELHRSIVDLGMVRDVAIEDMSVTVRLALTIPGCPLKEYFNRVVPERVRTACPEVASVRVELTSMTGEERSRIVGGVKIEVPRVGASGSRTRIVAVGSGKGGVGKSSVTVNLAAALVAAGNRVGLLDADIWGFSLPRMLGTTGRPTVVDDLIMPLQAHGMSILSIGNFVDDGAPIVWRGPMLHKALEQMLADVHWDDCDYLLIDMPPGTGDVSISLSQFLPTADSILVTTPHDTAQSVARRAARMMTQVNMRIVGVVENMSSFVCDGCDREHAIFGEGAGQRLAEELDVPLLARIPLDPRMALAAEKSVPFVHAEPDTPAAQRFTELAADLARRRRRRSLPLLT